MKKVKFLFLIYTLIFCSFSETQGKVISFTVTASFADATLSISDSTFKINDSNDLQIDVLKFYISNIQFLNKGKVVLGEKNSAYLIDFSLKVPIQFIVNNESNIEYDELKFNLGIDSAMNVAGALGGDLDPTKGMYWTWQSGYINFKLEGKSKLCKTRNNEFQFHLGGYQHPNNCIQNLSFPILNSSTINLDLDLKKIFSQINFENLNHLMSPSPEAVSVSKMIAQSFKIIEK
jgi:hypothetical protein